MREDASEAEFQRAIIDAAAIYNWLVWYQPDWVYRLIMRDMRQRRVRRDWPEPGFPDLWLVHPDNGKLLVFECKSQRGSVRDAQKRWVAALKAAGVDVRVVRPRDFDDVLALLSGSDEQ